MSHRVPRRRSALRGVAAGAAALLALGAATAAAAGGASASTAHRPRPSTVDVQILSFNDFHGHLEATDSPQSPLPPSCESDPKPLPCTPPVGGVEFLATHVKQLRAEQPRTTLTVAAGDLIGGSTFLSGLFQDQPSVEAMNTLGLDVSSVGNHEFDEGTDELLRMVRGGCQDSGCFKDANGEDIPYEGADFDYLAANVVKRSNDKPLLPATSVKWVKGVRVGFIGMTLQATPTLVSPAGVADVKFLDEVRTANKQARALMARGVKTIVVLVHEGGYQEAGISKCEGMSGPILDISKRLSPSIDLVVSGHTHQPYVCNIPDPDGHKRLVTSAGSYGQILTETHLTVNKRTGDVIRWREHGRNHLVTRDVTKNRAETNLLKFWKELAEPLANRVVGSVAEDIKGDSSTCRCEETPMVDTIADAILWGTADADKGGAQIAFMNTGGVRASFLYPPSGQEGPGEITYAEAYATSPFNNLLVTLDMTGAQIEDVLNQQYQAIDARGSRPMLSLGVSEGFTYDWAWDGTAPAPNTQPTVSGHVVQGSMKLDGVPIDPNKTYRVATLNFLADGGDSFTAFTEGTNRLGGAEDLANLVDFLGAHQGLKAPADRVNGL